MNDSLAQLAIRIRDELAEVERVLRRLEEGWQRAQRTADDYYLDGVALNHSQTSWSKRPPDESSRRRDCGAAPTSDLRRLSSDLRPLISDPFVRGPLVFLSAFQRLRASGAFQLFLTAPSVARLLTCNKQTPSDRPLRSALDSKRHRLTVIT